MILDTYTLADLQRGAFSVDDAPAIVVALVRAPDEVTLPDVGAEVAEVDWPTCPRCGMFVTAGELRGERPGATLVEGHGWVALAHLSCTEDEP